MYDPEDLETYVKDFARRNGLQDKFELLLFGARLARDKRETLSTYSAELTEVEKSIIMNESKASFWKQSKFLRATIITCSLAASIQSVSHFSLHNFAMRLTSRRGWTQSGKLNWKLDFYKLLRIG